MTTNRYQTIVVADEGEGVASVTLNRPQSLNAMNRQLIDDVAQAFCDVNENEAFRAVVFTGAGRAFCAGDDRKEHVHPGNAAEARELVDAIQNATRAIVFGSKPVIGAINGWAVGGGFEWAINCDFPIWAESAAGFFPEITLNLFVTGAVTSYLPMLVGLNRAREMLMLGDRYTAQQLLEMGVAWRVVPDDKLLDDAIAVARRLAAQPPRSLSAMKRVLNATALEIEAALDRETEATIAGFMDPETTRLLKDF